MISNELRSCYDGGRRPASAGPAWCGSPPSWVPCNCNTRLAIPARGSLPAASKISPFFNFCTMEWTPPCKPAHNRFPHNLVKTLPIQNQISANGVNKLRKSWSVICITICACTSAATRRRRVGRIPPTTAWNFTNFVHFSLNSSNLMLLKICGAFKNILAF